MNSNVYMVHGTRYVRTKLYAYYVDYVVLSFVPGTCTGTSYLDLLYSTELANTAKLVNR
jgi:hypothetical protein